MNKNGFCSLSERRYLNKWNNLPAHYFIISASEKILNDDKSASAAFYCYALAINSQSFYNEVTPLR